MRKLVSKILVIAMMLSLSVGGSLAQNYYSAPISTYSIDYDEYSDAGEVDEATFNKILLSCFINRVYVMIHHEWNNSEQSAFQSLKAEVLDLQRSLKLTSDQTDALSIKIMQTKWESLTPRQQKQIKSIEYILGISK